MELPWGATVLRGERACPALGREAALNLPARLSGGSALAVLGLLRSPTRGKPARHSKPAPTFFYCVRA